MHFEQLEDSLKLNVGGRTDFVLNKTDIKEHKGSFLYKLMSCGAWKADEQGIMLIMNLRI